jgi:DNA (cytosine-5)-methyltransferase 1
VFCGAGGAGMGYHRAGFRVIGIDNNPKVLRHYPFESICMDAMEFLDRYLTGEFERADAFHASPPCKADNQGVMCRRDSEMVRAKYKRLILPTRIKLQASGNPYVIENVPLARGQLINPIMLCGTMFGLKVKRHRYFECSFETLFMPAGCACKGKDGFTNASRGHSSFNNGAKLISVAGHIFCVEDAKIAMGIDWTGQDGLSQAIPPIYTEFIGKYLLQALKR